MAYGWHLPLPTVSMASASKHAPMLSRLIFSSHAPTLERSHIDVILASARRGNARLDLTGAMCFRDATFLQYIEGEASDLDTMYERIRVDARHARPVVLERSAIWSRLYASHPMRLLAWTHHSEATLRALQFRPAAGLGALSGQTAVTLFRALAALDSWEKD